MQFRVNRSNAGQTYFSFFRNIVPVLFLFSMASCGNEAKEKVNSTKDSAVIEDSTALVEPPKEKLMEFADTLYSRKMISDDTLKLIYSAIDNGKIKHGAYDFLPYLKNAKIIHIDTIERNRSPEKYMQNIYKEIISLIPGFVSFNDSVIHTFTPEPGVFGKSAKQKVELLSVVEEEESMIIGEKKYGHQWCMKVNYSHGTEFSDRCFQNEWEITDIINNRLDIQRLDYRVVPVHLYNKSGVFNAKHEFGVIVLSEQEGESLYLTDGSNDGAYIYPWFDMSAYYREYLTKDSIIKTMEEFKKLGLLSYLSSSQIKTVTEQLLAAPFLNTSEVIDFLPGIGDTLGVDEWDTIFDYSKILNRLSKISRGKFTPSQIRKSKNTNDYYTDDIVLSYKLKGNLFWCNLSETYFNEYSEYILFDFVNRSLLKSGVDGQFYEMAESEKILFLTSEQAQKIEEQELFYIYLPSPPPEKD